MTESDGPQNFLLESVPPRLESLTYQPLPSPLNAPAENQTHSSALLNAPTNLATHSSKTTESEVSENYSSPMDILSSSLENFASLSQCQVDLNGEIQTEVVAARNEIRRLKAQSSEVEQLHNVTQKLTVKI